MSNESNFCARPLTYDDPAEMRAIISAIPDGMRLANFPTHCEGAQCWCRPKVIFGQCMITVTHKDLGCGEFDC